MKPNNIYQIITDRIVEQMEQGIIPWNRPWTGAADGAINYVSRKPYSLLNQYLLGRSGEWLSWKQVKDNGGSVKKGAQAGMVCFYHQSVITDKNEDADGETEDKSKLIPILRYYHVFHIDDCEGIESKIKHEEPEITLQSDERAEAIINGYLTAEPHLRFQNDQPSGQAYFSPSRDTVVVPMLNQFSDVAEYYSTAFHELTHSTMMPNRCNRSDNNAGVAAFGSKDYSREELVAEMGAAMLVNICGLDAEKAFRNSVAYIQGWSRKLKEDPRAIVWAASRAEKAARYIQGER